MAEPVKSGNGDSSEEASPFPEYLSRDYREQLNKKFSKSMSGRLGEFGRVQVKVLVDKEGHVKKAEILTPSPYPRLDKFALDEVANWKFKPGKRNGVAEEREIKVPFVFEKDKN